MLTLRFLHALGVALLLFSLDIAAHAQRNGRWEFLGDANVSGNADHVRIIVTGSRVPFLALRIRVQNAAIELDRVVVHYGQETAAPIQVRGRIPAGGSTPVIDLPRDQRLIQSIELWYRRENWNTRQPKVRLFGMH